MSTLSDSMCSFLLSGSSFVSLDMCSVQGSPIALPANPILEKAIRALEVLEDVLNAVDTQHPEVFTGVVFSILLLSIMNYRHDNESKQEAILNNMGEKARYLQILDEMLT
ncbi:Hypothetical predicted protein [Olea europaea subsp. europaea]|uniref:Uncharacterized protein n=1 Tax=Olea europaea subsp. europaea TaxID=158383 RepID=A0A8S0U7Q7_OLEEU|nr:Hypothetical predicted protein [Olea europaea subsp. europaea]